MVVETWCARVASRVQLLTDAVAMAAANTAERLKLWIEHNAGHVDMEMIGRYLPRYSTLIVCSYT